jgi:hypothetical protein
VALWAAKQVSQHWGVTRARARSIPSSRHIKRISGHPVDEIRAVTR